MQKPKRNSSVDLYLKLNLAIFESSEDLSCLFVHGDGADLTAEFEELANNTVVIGWISWV